MKHLLSKHLRIFISAATIIALVSMPLEVAYAQTSPIGGTTAASKQYYFNPSTTVGTTANNTFSGQSYSSVGGALAACTNIGGIVSSGVKKLLRDDNSAARLQSGTGAGQMGQATTVASTNPALTDIANAPQAIASNCTTDDGKPGVKNALGCSALPPAVNKALASSPLGAFFSQGGNSVPVLDAKLQSLFQINTDNSTKQLNINQCLNGAAYAASKFILQQVANRTVSWINTGLNGGPLYVQNSGSYLTNLANQNIQQYIDYTPNTDPIFGNALRSALTQQVTGRYDGRMANGMQTPEGIAYQRFQGDFTQGGWNSLLNFNNNPLGAFFSTTGALQNKVDFAVRNARDEINRNNGFLDMKTCTKFANNGIVTNGLRDTAQCLEWKTTTPGSVIASQANQIFTSPVRQLENADKVNEAFGAFFDQLLNRLFSSGLSGFSQSTAPLFSSSTATNTATVMGATTIAPTTMIGYTASSSGGVANVDFDISRPQQLRSIIQTQYDFLNRSLDAQSVMDRIVPTLGSLDYCIPGPNPDWQNGVDSNFQTYLDSIGGGTTSNTTGSKIGSQLGSIGGSLGAAAIGTALGATLGSALPVVGTIIGSLLGGLIGGLFNKKTTTFQQQPSLYDKTTDTSGFTSPLTYVMYSEVSMDEFKKNMRNQYASETAILNQLYGPQQIDAMFTAAAGGDQSQTTQPTASAYCQRFFDQVTSGTFDPSALSDPSNSNALASIPRDCLVNPYYVPGNPSLSVPPTPVQQTQNSAVADAHAFVADALTMTKDLSVYNLAATQLDTQYATQNNDSRAAIIELESIRKSVNDIVSKAKERYVRDQAQNGTPVNTSCLDQAYVIDNRPITGVATQESSTVDPVVKQSRDAKVYFYTHL